MYAIARKAPFALRLRWQLRSILAARNGALPVLFAQGKSASPAARADVNAEAERLLDRYGNSILRLAYSYLHNMADAEEIVQDTLVQFLKEAPAFADETHEKAWCLRVAGNLAKNRIKYNQVRDADELNEELAAEEGDDLSFVWEAVKSLPVKYREVVHLFYHEGYTTAEIARILDRKEATVRSDLSRGREQLKTVLKEAYDFG
ncbi:MAG: sigma-70 family RNA polymerase sigma factor [Ruminococcaceae bacterium]|nr:sigma-70 family RNA polymerase sigma factor [Oscillospiraceae bacterium]